jgi:hypothetical protein
MCRPVISKKIPSLVLGQRKHRLKTIMEVLRVKMTLYGGPAPSQNYTLQLRRGWITVKHRHAARLVDPSPSLLLVPLPRIRGYPSGIAENETA